LKGVEVIWGGEVDIPNKYIAPTIVLNPPLDSKIMNEEIFGPLIPIITINNVDEAIKFINSRPKPLAAYIFSKNNTNISNFLNNTTSGGACVNDTVMHNACPGLPFGGVGPSGVGSYNGKFSFNSFSHNKGVLIKPLSKDPSLRYPPYTESKIGWLKRLAGLKLPSTTFFKVLIVPIVVAVLIFYTKDHLTISWK